MNRPIKIIFMGTPDFAVPTLCALDQSDYQVTLVVTQPDRPKGRGRKISPPPVKHTSMDLGYIIHQPESINDENLVLNIKKLKPDFLVVVAFGHILNRNILEIPQYGAINLHASILPRYRGPAPIQWSVINGDKETGVTTMFMDEGMDTGDILLTSKEKILDSDTSASLHDKLAQRGADLMLETIQQLLDNRVHPIPQNHTRATYAPMLNKNTGKIDWSLSASKISSLVRGVTPWPGAFTFHQKNRLKILSVKSLKSESDNPPGHILQGYPDELRVSTGSGTILIDNIQGPSGKKLPIKDFLRGYRFEPGEILK